MIARGRLVLLVACLSLCATAAVASAGPSAWTTYHYDGGRSGIDPDSSSPAAPAQSWQSGTLDGEVYGEPLVYGSTVYVATENDTVYALKASSGAVIWQQHVATPAPSSAQGCGDITPVIGITSTPVIDPSTGRIYVVGETWDGSSVHHQMFGLNLSDGSVGVGPVGVDPSGSTPKDQLQRAGLALDAGKVIAGFGGNYGDCGSYHGWLVAVPEGGGSLQTFEVDPSTNGGAIWGSGNAPPIDSSGNVWTATGNGSSSTFGYQESVIKLDSNLNRLDFWAPSNWSSLDSSDTDLGSTMPLLLPGGLVFEIGKSGTGYLLNASSLGGESGAPVYSASVCSGSWGGGIYDNGVIYVACSNGMRALSLNTSARSFTPVSGWSANAGTQGPPIAAGGLIWSADWSHGVLYGLDPGTGATKYSANLGSFAHFATPSAGGGKLFIANGKQVTAFQIAAAPGPAATTTALSSSANPSLAGKAVTYTATVSPVPDGGTVAFTDGGQPVSGCSAVALSAGKATCATSYAVGGRHAITAAYGGDSYFAGSSGALTQVVNAPSPRISRLRASAVHRKLRLTMTVSLPARLTVTVYRVAPGRIVHRRCLTSAKHGRRCRALVRRALLTLYARGGRQSFRPRMRALAPGPYVVSVTAVTITGGRSRAATKAFTVRRR